VYKRQVQAGEAKKGKALTQSQAYEMVVVEAEPAAREKQSVDALPETGGATRQLTATVLSSEDRRPVTGASVTLEGNEVVSITDPEGRFSIPVSGDDRSRVTARFAGMEPAEAELSSGEMGELVMNAVTPEAAGETQPAARISGDRAAQKGSYAGAAPEPAGGYIQFYQYIEENTQYPAGEDGPEEALVILRFRVTGNGKIRDVIAEISPGDPFTSEAVRLLRDGPPWIPGFGEDGPVEKQVLLRIVIKR
jgi:hypothetical protein